jgi:hypothetical protein
MITVDGRERWTLFDTGSRNTYVVPAVAELLVTSDTAHPMRTGLGGTTKEIKKRALLEAEVEGRFISTNAMVVDEIGRDEEGREIEALIGALAMKQWGVRLVVDEGKEKLDLTHYPEEFVEF